MLGSCAGVRQRLCLTGYCIHVFLPSQAHVGLLIFHYAQKHYYALAKLLSEPAFSLSICAAFSLADELITVCIADDFKGGPDGVTGERKVL